MPHITFIHGISNKPAADRLLGIWLNSLAQDLLGNDDSINLPLRGITSSMIYWADVLYTEPDSTGIFENASDYESTEKTAIAEKADPDMSWRTQLSGEEKEITDSLARKLSFDVLQDDDSISVAAPGSDTLERIPIPWFVKRRLMKWLLRDVHHYLFNETTTPQPGNTYKVQDEIRARVLSKLKEVKTDKHIVVSHSMGTVIIYDCLRRVHDCPPIDGLMTIGSPLGLDEIQDKFKPEWSRDNGYPDKLKGHWVNVYDSLDPVATFDGNLADDYRRGGVEIIEVIHEQNWGNWRHNITNYLSSPKLRYALNRLLS
jgi:hypothetical protein